MARPRTIDPELIAANMRAYVESRDFPIMAEFLTLHKYNKDTVHRLGKECESLTDTIKELHSKAEAYLVRESIAGNIPAVPAIFMLKQRQHGYTDKQEVTNTNVNFEGENLTEEEARKILKAAGIEL